MLPGAMAGAVEVLLTQPLEYYRVSRQLGQKPTLKHVFRGMGTRFMGVVPVRTVFWGVQEWGLSLDAPAATRVLAAGVGASLAQSIIELPFEHVKTRRVEGSSSLTSGMMRGLPWHLARNVGFALGVATGRYLGRQDAALDESIYLAACTIGSVVLTQPLDGMKTRMQSSSRIRIGLFTGVLPRCLQCCMAMGLGAAGIWVNNFMY